MKSELDQLLPKAFQMMIKIEQMAQDRLQKIKISVELGETTPKVLNVILNCIYL